MMEKTEYAIFTNICLITDDKSNVLVQNRRKSDWPGLAFPGGHVEPGESFTGSVIREVYEETGLIIENPVLCGVKQWQTETDARYVVFFYKANRFHGELRSSDEGEVFWLPRNQLNKQHLSIDMMDMVAVMESDTLSEFYYFQENGKWEFDLL